MFHIKLQSALGSGSHDPGHNKLLLYWKHQENIKEPYHKNIHEFQIPASWLTGKSMLVIWSPTSLAKLATDLSDICMTLLT